MNKQPSKLKQLPCLVDKCLVYPVCKTKELIDCDMLFDYYDRNSMLTKEKTLWFKIGKVLPNAIRIKKRIAEEAYHTFIKPRRPYHYWQFKSKRGW